MRQRSTWAVVVAGVLIVFGVIALLDNLEVAHVSWGLIWPIILIVIGALLIWGRSARHSAPGFERVVGDIKMEREGWTLQNQHIDSGIGNVHLDLTRAQIPEGETTLSVEAWIGNIDMLVPADLAVWLSGRVTLGSVTLLGDKSDGFVRQLEFKSPEYDASAKKVRIDASVIIGDIKIRRAG